MTGIRVWISRTNSFGSGDDRAIVQPLIVGGILPSCHRPAKTIEASYFMLVVEVKTRRYQTAKQEKDNQYHQTDNADATSGSVPVIAVAAAETTKPEPSALQIRTDSAYRAHKGRASAILMTFACAAEKR